MSIRRIAIVSNTYPPASIGGIGAAHLNLYHALERRGYEVSLFAYGELDATADKTLPFKCGLPPLTWRFVRKSIFLITRKRLPVFSGHLTDAISGLFLWPKILLCNPDIIVVPDHGPVSALIPRFPRTKTVFISHHNSARWLGQMPENRGKAKDITLASRLEQSAIIKASGAICPSSYMSEVFHRTYKANCPVEIIPNIVDSDWLDNIPQTQLRRDWDLDSETPLIYIPSAGNPVKGSGFVREIISNISKALGGKAAFYLSGLIDTDMLNTLHKLSECIKIITPGKQPYTTNIGNVKCCTLCISPCLTESFGMALLEAQFCELPVITFDAGGNQDIVLDGETGYLVECRNVDALVRRAIGLLQNINRLKQMSGKSRAMANERFHPDKVLNRYIAFFESLEAGL